MNDDRNSGNFLESMLPCFYSITENTRVGNTVTLIKYNLETTTLLNLFDFVKLYVILSQKLEKKD